MVKSKFPIKSLIGCAVYGLSQEYFDFGSQDWFVTLKPDILIGHPLYGYFMSALGRWGSEKVELLEGKQDLASRVVGGMGLIVKETADIIRYSNINALHIGDMIGGAFGILLENYQNLKQKNI